MSARQVQWCKPAPNNYGEPLRVSKCGRYRVQTMKMASGRNGYWNARAYSAEFAARPDRWIRIGRLCDTLEEALDAVDCKNDPTWEPD